MVPKELREYSTRAYQHHTNEETLLAVFLHPHFSNYVSKGHRQKMHSHGFNQMQTQGTAVTVFRQTFLDLYSLTQMSPATIPQLSCLLFVYNQLGKETPLRLVRKLCEKKQTSEKENGFTKKI